MPIRIPTQSDFFEKFLINRTEQALNAGFLWVLILKELSQQPLPFSQLRKQIARKHHNPHKTTLFSSIYLLQTMKLIQKINTSKGKAYEITPKGKQILERSIKHLKSNLAIVLGGE